MDLFSLALKLTTTGVREATKGLQEVDSQGQKTGRTLAVVERNSMGASTALTRMRTAATTAATGLQAQAAAATAAGTATRLLSGVVGLFAGGAALTAAVTLGLKLITAAYKALADQTSEATKRADEFTAALLRQAKARFEATVEGKRAEAARAVLDEGEAAAGLAAVGSRWFGNRNVFDAAKRRLDNAINARIEAEQQVTETEEREAGKQVTAIDKVTAAHVRAAKASGIDVPHMQGVHFAGLSQFEKGGDFVSEEIGGGVPDWMTNAFAMADAARKAAKAATDAALEAAQEQAERMQARLADIFSSAFVNGITQGFQGGGIGGAFKQLTATILQGFGVMLIEIGKKAIAASALMKALASAMAKLNPYVALAAGIALVALGNSMGGRGGSGAGGFGGGSGGNLGRGTAELTRIQFVDRQTLNSANVQPKSNFNVTIIGPNDSSAQRAMKELIANAGRRVA